MRANFGKALRQWLQQYRLLEILDFGDLPVFEEATTYPCILQIQKQMPAEFFRAANIPALEQGDFTAYVQGLHFESAQSALLAEGWTMADTRCNSCWKNSKKRVCRWGNMCRENLLWHQDWPQRSFCD